jgi:16S rRNA (guanine(527)-N(7))-methyltransferase RsmG
VNSERDELISILRRGANDEWRLGLTDLPISQFARYADLLVEWNATRMNLTRLTSPRDVAVKHFLDSLALLKAINIPEGIRVIDVGTGAGLPGIALKIARPDLDVTLLDSTAKKLTFCQTVIDALGLTGIRTIHGRAEEIGRSPEYHGQFSLVTARAVAALEKLLPWCAPFVKPGSGRIAALKGAMAEEELAVARPVAKRLRLKLGEPIAIALPEAEEETVRYIVVAVG